MTKKALVKRISEKLGGVTQKEAATVLDAVFASIAEGLHEDGSVHIGKWGTYVAEDMQ